MSESTIWWLLAGVAVAVELVTGTFYLLMIAVGFVAGAVAAHLGLALVGQIVVAAAAGGGAVALWHWHRSKSPPPCRPTQTATSTWTSASRYRSLHGIRTVRPL